MAKAFTPVVVTANDLVEGHSVFWGPTGWQADVALATVALDQAQADALSAEGAAAERANQIVGAYLVEVATAPTWPLLRREQIRASGLPTMVFGPQPTAAEAA